MRLVTPHRAFKLLALFSFAALAAPLCAAQGQAPPQSQTLERLREDLAMRYMEPEPHMALAKYHRDAGNRLLAFYILETARRTRFEEAVFDAAFKRHFLGEKPFDNGPAAEAKLLADLKRDPDSYDTLHGLADIYISREDYAKGREYLLRAIARRPGDFEDTEALAEVLRREGDEAAAEKVLAEWARLHPETAEARRIQIGLIAEKEPDKVKSLLAEAAAKFPREAFFPFMLAGLHLNEGNLKEAEALYTRAAELAPDSSEVQTWVGRFFFKAMPDDRRALEHYLSAYLLDPHAYETEFVESRIPTLNRRLAEARFKELTQAGTPLAKAAEDPDPRVAVLVLEEMQRRWNPSDLKTVLALMAHDDGGVRWRATELLDAKAGPSLDATVRALLEDKDLRRRGLAAYIAVRRWKAESFDLMRRMLREQAQLLRYDALSALIIEGGPEGRRVALEHAARESHPRLKKSLEAVAKEPRPQ